jgi:hypothetical protein
MKTLGTDMKTFGKETLPIVAIPIEKEKIKDLRFSHREVLADQEAIAKRHQELYRSQLLGNIFQSKVWIHFETADGRFFKVNTTIWAVGEKFIVLKQGVTIPISAIHHLD